MAGPKRYYFPDEEPETDFVAYEHWVEATRGLCGWCGQKGHQKADCPSRPLLA
jgi:hypothetical protein